MMTRDLVPPGDPVLAWVGRYRQPVGRATVLAILAADPGGEELDYIAPDRPVIVVGPLMFEPEPVAFAAWCAKKRTGEVEFARTHARYRYDDPERPMPILD